MAVLRDFLYLDDRLAGQYLSQLEGGSYDEELRSRVETEDRGREGTGGVGGFSARGSKTSSAEDTTSRTLRQTPEARYRRLERLIEDKDGMQWLEALDDDIYGQLRRGEAVQVESQIKVPTLYKLTEAATSVQPIVDLMQTLGEDIDDETRQQLDAAAQMGAAMPKVVVVAHAAGTPRFKFICELDREFIRQDASKLTGEAVVVGTVQRKLRATETFNVFDGFGIGALSRAERRQVERDMRKDKEMADGVVRAPAAMLTVIAVYR